jgi:hypothetical protein
MPLTISPTCSPLGFPDALLHHLARRLRRHAAEVLRRAFHDEDLAQLGLGMLLEGVRQRHFGALVLHLLHHFLLGGDDHGARFVVDLGQDLLRRGGVHRFAVGGNHRRLQGLNNHFPWKLLVVQHFVEGQRELFFHRPNLPVCFTFQASPAYKQKSGGCPLSETFLWGAA